MKEYQLGLLNTKDENEKAVKDHDDQLYLLPVDALQEKYDIENPRLTEREFEIMHMILSGLEIEDVANKIHLSIAGVKWRLTQVYNKFGVKNRLQLIEKSSTIGLHFLSADFIKHTFHNRIDLRGHEILELDGEVNAE